MRRREFIALLGGAISALTAKPKSLGAQEARSIPQIGYMVTSSFETPEARRSVDAWRQGLRENGYIEGQNIAVTYRSAAGDIERFPALAAELVRLKVDVIVAPNTPATRAAQQATATIPIVTNVMGDPIGDGLVASLSRPGGNVTGLTFLGPELVPKRVELLRQALPGMSRAAVLWHPNAFGEQTTKEMLHEAETAAGNMGMQVGFTDVNNVGDLDRAFSAIAAERADALIVFPGPMFFNERRQVVNLAAKYRLPASFSAREFVELGGLMSYGASIYDLVRRTATFVDKILKGAKPSELPVEQPTKFELVINLKAAKALGLDIPPTLLARADEVIE
jgi:putative tryptophan/tyrosine transport system substrate-binding protein